MMSFDDALGGPSRWTRRSMLSTLASAMLVRRAVAGGRSPANVLVIPSIHKRLAGNPHYNYADLYSLVAAFQPDRVGVEIRQEDLARPDTYLRRNYPEEMVVLAGTYKARVFGFDWLGKELEGRAIPDNWWTQQSPIKRLERICSSGPPDVSPRGVRLNARLDELSRQQDDIVRTATATSLADGRYDRVTVDYYRIAAELTHGTPCEALSKRYAERDQRISANIVGEVVREPGRRIAVVTGVDHHGPVMAALSRLGASVVLSPV